MNTRCPTCHGRGIYAPRSCIRCNGTGAEIAPVPAKPLREAVAKWLFELTDPRDWEALHDSKQEFWLEHTDQLLALFREHGYVRLEKDQKLPTPYGSIADEISSEAAYNEMWQAGWRKIKP